MPNSVPIPRGSIGAQVLPVDIKIRLLPEYDITFMQDRIRADLFVNGVPAGPYAVAAVDDYFSSQGQYGIQRAMETHAEGLQRMVIDQMMGHGLRSQIKDLERTVESLQARLDRPNWVVRAALAVRNKLGSWFR